MILADDELDDDCVALSGSPGKCLAIKKLLLILKSHSVYQDCLLYTSDAADE